MRRPVAVLLFALTGFCLAATPGPCLAATPRLDDAQALAEKTGKPVLVEAYLPGG